MIKRFKYEIIDCYIYREFDSDIILKSPFKFKEFYNASWILPFIYTDLNTKLNQKYVKKLLRLLKDCGDKERGYTYINHEKPSDYGKLMKIYSKEIFLEGYEIPNFLKLPKEVEDL